MTRALAAAALLVLAAACGGSGPQSSARPVVTPSAISTPEVTPASTPASGQPVRCHTPDLSLRAVSRPDGGAGNFVQELGLTNRTATPCWVQGYVGMGLLDAAGGGLPTRVVRDPGSRFPFAHVGRYLVPAGATAPFWVHWEQVPTGTETTCPTAAGLIVTPPDETTTLRLDGVQITACNGGELDVSPVTAPGTTGPGG